MKPVIRLEHIEKVFTDGKEDFEALRDVSLEVNEGDIFGIIGLSGAGRRAVVRGGLRRARAGRSSAWQLRACLPTTRRSSSATRRRARSTP